MDAWIQKVCAEYVALVQSQEAVVRYFYCLQLPAAEIKKADTDATGTTPARAYKRYELSNLLFAGSPPRAEPSAQYSNL